MLELNELHSAIRFVIDRISEEAERSGAPLEDDEKDFLHHLPAQPTNPTIASGFDFAYEYSWPTPAIRDLRFERLCALAKNAHKHDLAASPNAVRRWHFAAAILQSHHHPLSWLLTWAGVRIKKARIADLFLLVVTALLLVTLLVGGIVGLATIAEDRTEIGKRIEWIVGAGGLAGVPFSVYLLARRAEKSRQRRILERYRCDLRLTD